jgi:hypothetical protein
VGGYLRRLSFYVQASAGNYSAATATADAPYNAIQNMFFRDPFGQPIIQASGYALFLINLYGGQTGALGFGNQPNTLPSWSALNTTTGAFNFRLDIPL